MALAGHLLQTMSLYSSIVCPHKLPIAGNIGTDYLEKLPGGWKIKCCPTGQLFVPDECTCMPEKLIGKKKDLLYILRRKDGHHYSRERKKGLRFKGKSENIDIYETDPSSSKPSYEFHRSFEDHHSPDLLTSSPQGLQKNINFIEKNLREFKQKQSRSREVQLNSEDSMPIRRHRFIIIKHPPRKLKLQVSRNNRIPHNIKRFQSPLPDNTQIEINDFEYSLRNSMNVFPSVQGINSNGISNNKILNYQLHPNSLSLSNTNGLNIHGGHSNQVRNGGHSHNLGMDFQSRQNAGQKNAQDNAFNIPIQQLQRVLNENSLNTREIASHQLEGATSHGVPEIISGNSFSDFLDISNMNPALQQDSHDNSALFQIDQRINTLDNVANQEQFNNIPFQDQGVVHMNNFVNQPQSDNIQFLSDTGVNSINDLAHQTQLNSIPFQGGQEIVNQEQVNIDPFRTDPGVHNTNNIANQQQVNNVPFQTSNIAYQQQVNNVPFQTSNIINQQQINDMPFQIDPGVHNGNDIVNQKPINDVIFQTGTNFENIANQLLKKIPFQSVTDVKNLDNGVSQQQTETNIVFQNHPGAKSVSNLPHQQQSDNVPFHTVSGTHDFTSIANPQQDSNVQFHSGLNNVNNVENHQLQENNIQFQTNSIDVIGDNNGVFLQTESVTSSRDSNRASHSLPSNRPADSKTTPLNSAGFSEFSIINTPLQPRNTYSVLISNKRGFTYNKPSQNNGISETVPPVNLVTAQKYSTLTSQTINNNIDISFSDPVSSRQNLSEFQQSDVNLNNENDMIFTKPGIFPFENNGNPSTIIENSNNFNTEPKVNSVHEGGQTMMHGLDMVGSTDTNKAPSSQPSISSAPVSPLLVKTSSSLLKKHSVNVVPVSNIIHVEQSNNEPNSGSVIGLIQSKPNNQRETSRQQGGIQSLNGVGGFLSGLLDKLSSSSDLLATTVNQGTGEQRLVDVSAAPASNKNENSLASINNINTVRENVINDPLKNNAGGFVNSLPELGHTLNFPDESFQRNLHVVTLGGNSNINPSTYMADIANNVQTKGNRPTDLSNGAPITELNVNGGDLIRLKKRGDAFVDNIKTLSANNNGLLSVPDRKYIDPSSYGPITHGSSLDNVEMIKDKSINGVTGTSNNPNPDAQTVGQAPDVITQVKQFVKKGLFAAFDTVNRHSELPPSSELIQPNKVNIQLLNGIGKFLSPTGNDLHMSQDTVVDTSGQLSPEICMGCALDGGLGYTSHPTRCDQFVVCYPDTGGTFRPIAQNCPYGQFWSKKDVTCRPSKNVRCNNDICNRLGTGYLYSNPASCVSYWECQGGFSVARCCPPGQAFTETGCQPAKQCKDVCPDDGLFVWDVGCNKRSIANTASEFQKYTFSGGWKNNTCGVGAVFKREICDCVPVHKDIPSYSFNETCRPEVFLPFDSDFLDYSGSEAFVRKENVSLVNGAACFNGSSVLALPKFANMDLGNTVYIKIRYKQGDYGPRTEALLYYGDCEEKPTVVIGTKPSGNSFTVRTTSNEIQTIWVPSSVPPNDWREVIMTINVDRIEGQTDTYSTSTYLSGGVSRSVCGIKLGWGKGYGGFVGCIDEVSLYRCYPGATIAMPDT